LTPEFALEISKFQILINPALLTKGSRNLKSVALKTAEISSKQISTNARIATPTTPATPSEYELHQSSLTDEGLPQGYLKSVGLRSKIILKSLLIFFRKIARWLKFLLKDVFNEALFGFFFQNWKFLKFI
jgi:hypothetical protein